MFEKVVKFLFQQNWTMVNFSAVHYLFFSVDVYLDNYKVSAFVRPLRLNLKIIYLIHCRQDTKITHVSYESQNFCNYNDI